MIQPCGKQKENFCQHQPVSSKQSFSSLVRRCQSHTLVSKYFISTSLSISTVLKHHYSSGGHQAGAPSSRASLYCSKVGIHLLLRADVASQRKGRDAVMSPPRGGQTSSPAGQLAHTFISQAVTGPEQLPHIRSDLQSKEKPLQPNVSLNHRPPEPNRGCQLVAPSIPTVFVLVGVWPSPNNG